MEYIRINDTNVEVNSHCVNKAIQFHILDRPTMKAHGFTDKYYEGQSCEQDAPYWYMFRGIKFPKDKRYKGIDISFNIHLPKKDGDELNIYVLDEDFGQPYDYQRMIEDNPSFDSTLVSHIVFKQVEEIMTELQEAGILSGHNYGDYI